MPLRALQLVFAALAATLTFVTPRNVYGQNAPAPMRPQLPSSTLLSPSEASGRSPKLKMRQQTVTIAFVGDVHFEPPIRAVLEADPAAVFAKVAPALRRADLAIANLETAVTTRGSPEPKKYTFRAPRTAFLALREAGFSLVTMANNHGIDFGPVGLQDTLAAAASEDFKVIGIGVDGAAAYRAFKVTLHGQRVSFLAATQVLDGALQQRWTASETNPGLASAKPRFLKRLLHAVRSARNGSDTVIVYLHWGTELVPCPTAAQRLLASELAKAGADIIVGSHAHVLLGRGFLGNAFVDYGLGNFAFYAKPGRAARTGILLLNVRGRQVLNSTWIPAVIVGGLPHLLSGRSAVAARHAADALRSCTNLSAQPE